MKKLNIRKYKLSFVLIILLVLCHVYMHSIVFDFANLSKAYTFGSVTYMFFDVIGVIFIGGLLSLFRSRRFAYTFAWLTLFVFDIVNIVYSRFFFQYFSFSALKEAGNLRGGWWQQYISTAVCPSDILLFAFSSLFFWILFSKRFDYYFRSQQLEKIKLVVLLCLIPLPNVFLTDVLEWRSGSFPKNTREYFSNIQGERFFSKYSVMSDMIICRYGLLRTQIFYSIFNRNTDIVLSEEQNNQIQNYVSNSQKQLLVDGFVSDNNRNNIDFIIVESFLSVVVDMKIDGKEVTPNLNIIKRLSNTYYNGNMTSSIGLGESSDAQLLYFTGLCPLKNEITVPVILNREVVALPSILHESHGYHTYMTIPTNKYVWHQNEINNRYGIDNLYSTVSNSMDFLNEDDRVIKCAIDNNKTMEHPYFHTILTASMHSPYSTTKDFVKKPTFKFPDNFSREYCNYLEACHFMDKQIGKYLDYLKKTNNFQNTTLIIVSDHPAHAELLNMPVDAINNEYMPLFIVNDPNADKAYTSKISQLDVFPSLLDLFSIKSQWRGIGKSIYRKYNEPRIISDVDKNISELIVRGNWFKLQNKKNN